MTGDVFLFSDISFFFLPFRFTACQPWGPDNCPLSELRFTLRVADIAGSGNIYGGTRPGAFYTVAILRYAVLPVRDAFKTLL